MKHIVPFLLATNLLIGFVLFLRFLPVVHPKSFNVGDCVEEKIHNQTYKWKVTQSSSQQYKIKLNEKELEELTEKATFELNSKKIACNS